MKRTPTLLLAFAGLAAAAWLLAIPAEAGALFGISRARFTLLLGILLPALALFVLAYRLAWWERVSALGRWVDPGAVIVLGLALGGLLTRPYLAENGILMLARLSPLLVYWGLLALAWLALRWEAAGVQSRWRLALSVIVLACASLYLAGALYHWRTVNVAADVGDQGEYARLAIFAHEQGLAFTGYRHHMPLYPWLQAPFVKDGQDAEAVLQQGKLVNIGLSLLLLAGVWWVIRRFFKLPQAALLTLITAFSLYLLKSAYMEVELLYYFLAFLAYVLLLRLLARPNWKLALAAGSVLALAHYAKASTPPTIALFAAVGGLYGVACLIEARRRNLPLVGEQGRQMLFSVLLVVLAWLAVLSPYLLESQQRFGSAFYNVNSTFYFWLNDWEEATAMKAQYDLGSGWPELSPEETPSLGKYLREHSLGEIASRLWLGWLDEFGVYWRQYGLVSFQAIYLVALLALAIWQRAAAWEAVRAHWALVLFALGYFIGNGSFVAWWLPMAGQTARYTLAMYIPLLFSVYFGLDWLARRVGHRQVAGQRVSLPTALDGLNIVVALLLGYNILFTIPQVLQHLIY